MSKVNVNAIEPSTGTDITLGASGDTITVPAGATFTQSGTMNASAITAGTMATARLGSGTASSSTFLRGDGTWASAGGDNTPYFFAERTGSNQTINNTTITTIQYNTATINEGSCYDTSTYKFTPTTAGVYFFRAKMAWNSVLDWDNSEMQLLKNSGSTILDRYTFSNVYYNSCIVAGTVSLTTSDSVYAFIYQSSGSSKDLLYGGWSSFTGWKLIA